MFMFFPRVTINIKRIEIANEACNYKHFKITVQSTVSKGEETLKRFR